MISLSIEKQTIRHINQIGINDGLSLEHIEEHIPVGLSSLNYRKLYGMGNGIGRLVHIGCYGIDHTLSSFHLYKGETPIATISLDAYMAIGFSSYHKMLMKSWNNMMRDIFTLNPDELIKKYTSRYHILKPVPTMSWYNLLLNMIDGLCGDHTMYDEIMARISFNYRDKPISTVHNIVKQLEILLKNVHITLYNEQRLISTIGSMMMSNDLV